MDKIKRALAGKSSKTSSQTSDKSNSAKSKTNTKSKKNSPKQVLSGIKLINKSAKSFFNNTKSWQKLINKKINKKINKLEKVDKALAKKSQKTKKTWSAPKLLRILLFPIINPFARIFLLTLFILGIGGLLYVLRDLPSPRRLTSTENFAVSTQIFDRNGELLYEIFADENRIPVDIDDLPDHVLDATVAIEDQRFYNHLGFDVIGITRALRNNLSGQPIEGGSTITQQLVKNALLTPERSLKRKMKEAVLAVFTEILYSKREILEMYLNYISYGGTSVGIEAAANRYFDKHAADLTVAEAALLAGLPQAPSRYSPFGSNPQTAKERQLEVLKRMRDDNYISQEEFDQASNQTLEYALSTTDIKAPHFVFYVRDKLYEEYGVETVERGGLRVTTTLDLSLQDAAQASVSAEVANLTRHRVGNGASMVVKPNTGEILAMIGSKDYFNVEEDGQVNVALAFRQPGSSIKPIMYATGFQTGLLNPGTVLIDVPSCFKVPNQKDYCPKNYDGSFKGPVSVRDSLGNSLNIPAVKALATIGLETFIHQANEMGITTWTDPSQYGLSLTLGGGEVRMIDMAQAFSVLANQGVKVPLTSILKVEDYQGKLLEEVDVEQRKEDLEELNQFEIFQIGDLERVMDRAPAYLTSHIMQDNNARIQAFGPRSELVIPNQIVSAKTGTTNDLKDNWTVGFTPEFLTIVWVGNNDNTPMNPYLVSGVTGAAPIFNDIMSYILQDKEPVWQEKPADVASAPVCASGFPPQEENSCEPRYTELYWEDSQPSVSEQYKKEVWVRPETGLPLAPGESEDGLILEEHTFYRDPVTEEYCLDCNRAVDEEGKIIYEQKIINYTDN